MLPNTNYTGCIYLQSADATVTSSPTCTTFTTPNYPYPLYRALLTFNSPLSSSQRNSLLCYFDDQVKPWYDDDIINLRAESCNRTGSTPQTDYYIYQNTTDDVGTVQVIYLTTYYNTTLYTTAVTNFQNLFNPTTNNTLSTIASGIQTATGVTLLSGVYQGSVNYNDFRAGTRTVTVDTPILSSNTVTLQNVKLSGGNGAIYWGLSTSSASTPSVEQLFNCQDGSNATLLDCKRQVFASDQTGS